MREKELIIHTTARALISTVAAVVVMGIAATASAVAVCDPIPLGVLDGCIEANKTKILIHDDPNPLKAAKDKLKWSWLKGGILSGEALGNPLTGGTEYALCIYDGAGGVPVLVKELQAPAGAVYWRVKSQNGFQYKDTTRSNDGLLKVRLKADPIRLGRSQVKLSARGAALQPPGPPLAFPLQYFEQDPSVIINLVNTEGTCWTSEYLPASAGGDVRKNVARDFRAQTR